MGFLQGRPLMSRVWPQGHTEKIEAKGAAKAPAKKK
jgi:hypothetical protein